MRHISVVVLSVGLQALAGTVASPAFAQASLEPRVPITGVVLDMTGGAVPGVVVTLRVRGTAPQTATTDAAGRFTFPQPAHGPATVSVAAPQFAPVDVPVTHPAVDVSVVLRPLPLVEQVSVEAPVLRDAVTRSATRTATPLRDVPQAVAVVTQAHIAEMSMQGMADVVRYMPGVGMAQGESNRDAPVLRGNTSTSDFFVDGIRDDAQYFRDLYNVDRVEALKGPNAMIFGRGGVGGVINRVTKQPAWTPVREITLQGGSWSNRRLTGDFGDGLSGSVAYRVTGMFEDSGSYRRGASLERRGVNPTLGASLGAKTMLRVGYEHFFDARTADRGVPSLDGRPVATPPSTFFGNADASRSETTVNALSIAVDRTLRDAVQLTNRTLVANYDKFYQNIYPGAVNAAAMTVSLSGYHDATDRTNVFNQTDVAVIGRTGRVTHRLLAGAEFGRQVTDNRRNTAFFTSISPSTTSIHVPLSDPTTSLPVTFRPGATDADNHGVATIAAGYLQDQVQLGRHLEAVAGVRYDRFQVRFLNNRTAAQFASDDNLVSPRVGLIYKPVEPVSVYSSYTLSYLPRAGEQLRSLNLTNQALDPETFRNYEVGVKWDLRTLLSFSAAAYRLDRGNVAVPAANDPTRTELVDGQRTKGVELGLIGNVSAAWSVMAGYAYQDARLTHTQSPSAQAGAVLPQTPRHSFSVWNRYDLAARLGAGLGVIRRGAIFAATDNAVVLPGFTRLDAAVFFGITPRLRAQVNVENVLNEAYFASAHSNSNITPGAPRGVRVSLTTAF